MNLQEFKKRDRQERNLVAVLTEREGGGTHEKRFRSLRNWKKYRNRHHDSVTGYKLYEEQDDGCRVLMKEGEFIPRSDAERNHLRNRKNRNRRKRSKRLRKEAELAMIAANKLRPTRW